MSRRSEVGVFFVMAVTASMLVGGAPTVARAQVGSARVGSAQAGSMPAASDYLDPVGGMSLGQAIARALEMEPSLRAIRSDVDIARGARQQAALKPNPSVSFERREEPGGTDHLTNVSIEWPLDLFRRTGRVAVADLEISAATLAAADRERLLTAEVRAQYGEVAASVREIEIFDELVDAARRQYELLRARADEGTSPPLERDVVDVELRRLQSERLMRAGRVDAALVQLKRLLGMQPDAKLTLRDTLESLVHGDKLNPAATDARPDVRQAAARVDLAQARIDRAARDGRFDVGLYGSYMRMDSGFAQRGFGPTGALERVRGQFNYFSAGATVTLPFLDRKQGDIASARAEHASATATLDAAKLTAATEAAAARLRFERARQAVNLYTDGARTLARHNLTVVGQSYELGRVTVFDVLAEQRRYLDNERAYIEALRAAYDASTALKLALGEIK